MRASDLSLGWFRDLHLAAQTPDARADVDLVDAARSIGLMAQATPAWTEPYVGVLDQLIEADPTPELVELRSLIDMSTDSRRDRSTAGSLASCPQIVDVDFPTMGFDRAEWIDGNLHLGLAPAVEDATKSTSFRVIGAEPRIWDLHGIQNVRMESRLSGLNVRVPMVKADVTLIRSSY